MFGRIKHFSTPKTSYEVRLDVSDRIFTIRDMHQPEGKTAVLVYGDVTTCLQDFHAITKPEQCAEYITNAA